MKWTEKLKGLFTKDLTGLSEKAPEIEQSINQLPQKVMSDTTLSFDPTLAIGAIQGQVNELTSKRDEAQAAMQKSIDDTNAEIKNLNGAIQYLQAFAAQTAPATQPDAATPTDGSTDGTTEDNAAAKGLG